MFLDGFESSEHIRRERRRAQELRASSWWRQRLGEGVCYHCGERFAKELLTMDHVVPLSRGGRSTKKNVVVACKPCNTDKGCLFAVERAFAELEKNRAAPESLNDVEKLDFEHQS